MKKNTALQVLLSASLVLGGALGAGAVDAEAATAKVERSVSMREQPSTTSSRIRYAKAGERLDILSMPNSYWLKVKDAAGRIGYISSSDTYVDVIEDSAAGKTSGTLAAAKTVSASAAAQKVIAAGKKYLGTPYEFGSSRLSTKTFDCSDFVRQAFKDGIKLTLPSNSQAQADYAKNKGAAATSWSKLKPGDLMFFMAYKGTKSSDYKSIAKSKQRVTHVGIYLGDGKMIHTYSKSSGGVRIDSIDNKHWEYRFIFGGSVL